MSAQAEHLERVSDRIAGALIAFCRSHDGETFHADDLRRYVSAQCGEIAPGSADRILRDLRQKGIVAYAIVSRRDSLYLAGAQHSVVPLAWAWGSDRYHMVSHPAGFTVCRVIVPVAGVPTTVYEAWDVRPKLADPYAQAVLLGSYPFQPDAQARAALTYALRTTP